MKYLINQDFKKSAKMLRTEDLYKSIVYSSIVIKEGGDGEWSKSDLGKLYYYMWACYIEMKERLGCDAPECNLALDYIHPTSRYVFENDILMMDSEPPLWLTPERVKKNLQELIRDSKYYECVKIPERLIMNPDPEKEFPVWHFCVECGKTWKDDECHKAKDHGHQHPDIRTVSTNTMHVRCDF